MPNNDIARSVEMRDAGHDAAGGHDSCPREGREETGDVAV